MTRWWLGETSWAELIGHPEVKIHGDNALVRQMHRWFQRYVFAPDDLAPGTLRA